MLHLLTVGDLFEVRKLIYLLILIVLLWTMIWTFQMRISNMLHHLSIKSGIQVLRFAINTQIRTWFMFFENWSFSYAWSSFI